MLSKKLTGFFCMKAVKQKILSDTLPDSHIFIYFCMTLLYDAIGFTQQYVATAGKQPTHLDWLNVWGSLKVTTIGLIVLFLANGGTNGRNFLMKYVPLSIIVGYKYGIAHLIAVTLSVFIPSLKNLIYGVGCIVILNILMVINITCQIYSLR